MKKIIRKIKDRFSRSSDKVLSEEKEARVKRVKKPIFSDTFKKIIKSIALFIIIVIALVEFVFAILIYGFHIENGLVKYICKIIPFPAAYTSSGIITMNQFYYEKDYVNHFYSATSQGAVNQSELKKQIINQLVENKIIVDEAVKYKIRVTAKDVDDTLNKIVEENGGEEEVEKVLDELYGLNIKEFNNLIKSQLLRDKINQDALVKVKAEHILIRVDEDAPEDKVNEAKAKIDQYYNEIKSGLDFSEAAKKYSEDVGSNEQGGELEPFSRGDMIEEFEKIAFEIPAGETSEPFRTAFGWHIVQVEQKTGFIDKGFQEWINGLTSKSMILVLYVR